MLAVGYAANVLGGRGRAVFGKAAAAFMFVLACSMVGRGLAIAGVDVVAAVPIGGADVVRAQIVNGAQVAEFDLSFDSYADISVKLGIPVQLVVNADAGTITGCNNEIVIGEWGIDKPLSPGRNVIEFTPTEAGTFTYSCWMHMITNTIEVTE